MFLMQQLATLMDPPERFLQMGRSPNSLSALGLFTDKCPHSNKKQTKKKMHKFTVYEVKTGTFIPLVRIHTLVSS